MLKRPRRRYWREDEVPSKCPHPGCGGLFRWTETGVSCRTSGHEYIVEERLMQTWNAGRQIPDCPQR